MQIHASTVNKDPKNVIRLATDLRFVDSSKPWDEVRADPETLCLEKFVTELTNIPSNLTEVGQSVPCGRRRVNHSVRCRLISWRWLIVMFFKGRRIPMLGGVLSGSEPWAMRGPDRSG